MITLRAGELAETDGHHLEEPAFDLAREVGVPLDAPNQENAIGAVRVLVHEGLDAIRRVPQGHHFERAHHRATHRPFVDAEVREHIGLAFRRGRPVAAHCGEEKRLEAA